MTQYTVQEIRDMCRLCRHHEQLRNDSKRRCSKFYKTVMEWNRDPQVGCRCYENKEGE